MKARSPKNLKKVFEHQRRLSVLKFILMASIILLFLFIFIGSSFFQDRGVVMKEENSSSVMLEQIAEKHVLNPNFEGVDAQDQPYKVIAKSANQETENQINLIEPIGEITLKNGTTVRLVAASGVLTEGNTQLDLKGDVHFNYEECSVDTQEAHANLSDRSVQGTQVYSKCPQGTINAGGFLVDHEKNVVTYTNRPHLVIQKKVSNDTKENAHKE